MANFCVKCGSPLIGGPFCTKCGTDARSVTQSAQAQPTSATLQPPQATAPSVHAGTPSVITPPGAQTVAQPSTPKKGMSTLAKLGIAALGVVLVGGAAGAVGVYYVAHKVSQKYQEVKDQVLGSSSGTSSGENSRDGGSGPVSLSSSSGSSNNSLGNVCRFLSKEDVGKAIGIEIIRAEPGDNTCNYIAKGTQADMTAKHAAAMLGDKGADKKTQQLAEQFAGGIFKMTQENKPQSKQDAAGEVPVFNFGLDQNNAEAQMRLNAKGLAVLGSQEGLPGIGDQAFVQADGMILARKGKTLIRIMYITCPCGLEQVKPLAKKLADSL